MAMDLSGWIKELGKPQTILLAVLAWLALQVYEAVREHDRAISRLEVEMHDRGTDITKRVATLEGVVSQIRETQRDFVNLWMKNPIKPPGIQHPDVDHAE